MRALAVFLCLSCALSQQELPLPVTFHDIRLAEGVTRAPVIPKDASSPGASSSSASPLKTAAAPAAAAPAYSIPTQFVPPPYGPPSLAVYDGQCFNYSHVTPSSALVLSPPPPISYVFCPFRNVTSSPSGSLVYVFSGYDTQVFHSSPFVSVSPAGDPVPELYDHAMVFSPVVVGVGASSSQSPSSVPASPVGLRFLLKCLDVQSTSGSSSSTPLPSSSPPRDWSSSPLGGLGGGVLLASADSSSSRPNPSSSSAPHTWLEGLWYVPFRCSSLEGRWLEEGRKRAEKGRADFEEEKDARRKEAERKAEEERKREAERIEREKADKARKEKGCPSCPACPKTS